LIAVDSNVLVMAHREETSGHEGGLAVLRGLAEGTAPWGIPVFVLGEFLRVVTHPRVFGPPSSIEEAFEFLAGILGSPSSRLLLPSTRYWVTFRDAATQAGATGNLVFDAQIAAVCLENSATTILTEDRDFHRFQGLTVRSVG